MSDHGVKHLAIIMDGNRRWAKEHGLPPFEGHRRGYDKLKEAGDWCLARGIEVLTVFAFSTENWKRTAEEVNYLMDLLELALTKELDHFKSRGVRVRVIGRRDGLRDSIRRAIDRAEDETKNLSNVTLCICLNYGGRPEIVDAVKKIVAEKTPPDRLTEESVRQHLYWPEMPDPDLVIRTSGEERISGFLLWELAYSEFYWEKKHWPAFEETDLDVALADFAARQRRYGK